MLVLRPLLWQRVFVAVALSSLAAVLVAGGVDAGGLLLVGGLVSGALVLLAAWLQDRQRVELGGENVVVVNLFRTLVIPWREVERFGYDGGAWVRRRDMRQHRITAFCPSSRALPLVERQCRRAAKRMEDRRKQRRRGGGGRDR